MPNITGSISGNGTYGAIVGLARDELQQVGALHKSSRSGKGAQLGVSNSTFDIEFTASYSNAIYGASDHVTPINASVKIWQRIS